ncbi:MULTISPECIES: hypothetical protein [unclassified Synechococcus]|jgi:hypothetical protein|uniref:hypothetical protein n=1 Tax=unclassified Synechococcus TaxID=2626047 RepID=UPI000B990060|nr:MULTISPECIES: hypothetical protein [unclassified Synechococcus]MCP9829488.1 hypothetical protein [Synechococcus sp. L2F]MCP9847564.1 hypothetical protein [Synechococcus sp. Lug-A]
MAGHNGSTRGGSTILASAIAGAVVGAAGLAWWLLDAAERRRLAERQRRRLTLSRFQDGPSEGEGYIRRPLLEKELQHKVQELNQAIEDVRRQLECLTPDN